MGPRAKLSPKLLFSTAPFFRQPLRDALLWGNLEPKEVAALSPREREVLRALVAGRRVCDARVVADHKTTLDTRQVFCRLDTEGAGIADRPCVTTPIRREVGLRSILHDCK